MLPRLRLPLRGRRDIVCQQAVELVTDYLEGALSRADRRRFEAHLAGCPHCTEYLAQMRATIALTGDLTADDLTPQMQDEFIALYRQWSAGQGSSGQQRAGRAGVTLGRRRQSRGALVKFGPAWPGRRAMW